MRTLRGKYARIYRSIQDKRVHISFSNSITLATIKGKNKNKRIQFASISQLARNIV